MSSPEGRLDTAGAPGPDALLAKLGSRVVDVDLEFSGGVSESGLVDVGLDVLVDGG